MTILDKCSADQLAAASERLRAFAGRKTKCAEAKVLLSKHGDDMRVALAQAADMRSDADLLQFAAEALDGIAAIKRRKSA